MVSDLQDMSYSIYFIILLLLCNLKTKIKNKLQLIKNISFFITGPNRNVIFKYDGGAGNADKI